ncbi:hypothetical protein Dsin_019356 [Dipteronia sinensis]|uniref:RNase H type-1 domain-containing protein n=1 Tax=Dipteronia sinensis TaxID=43782 RepID=A0AAE0A7D5_9ROSI|nr:hypothetical protein Dsin_019356 [Dipteronia sinensis]
MAYFSHTFHQHKMKLLCVFFWLTWFRRNQVVHGGVCESNEDVVGWASSYLLDFHEANINPHVSSRVDQMKMVKWRCPNEGIFKLNSDATFDDSQRNIGFGLIIRNHNSLVMGSSIQSLFVKFSPQISEVIAIF